MSPRRWKPCHNPAARPGEEVSALQPEQVALARGDGCASPRTDLRGKHGGGCWAKGKDRLNNGAVYEVEGFTKEGDIRLANGFVVPKDYGGITHGYVVTSHASQGKTVDVSLVALGRNPSRRRTGSSSTCRCRAAGKRCGSIPMTRPR
jgi:hypothetical protein